MTDLTPFEGIPERVLCVVAHPDDIEYGAAAAIHRWVGEGAEVAYFLLTSGEAGIDTIAPEQAGPLRQAEERESARRVGVSTVEFGDWPDGAIEYGVRLRRDIAEAIRRHRPDVIVGQTWSERFGGGTVNQADHRAVGLATLDAIADAGNRWLHRDLPVALQPWGGVRAYLIAGGAAATHYVDVSGEHFEAAVHSLEAHAAFNAALPADFPAPRQLLGMILGGAAQAVDDPAVTHAFVVEAVRFGIPEPARDDGAAGV